MWKALHKYGLAAALLLVATFAEAQSSYHWSSTAAGCVPDSTTIADQRYVSTPIGSVMHKPLNLTRITLNCPVHFIPKIDNLPPPNVMFIFYRDTSPQTANATFVRVTLFRLPMDPPQAVAQTFATFSSKTAFPYPASSELITYRSIDLPPQQLELNRYSYYIRIELARSSANHTVIIFGVALGYRV